MKFKHKKLIICMLGTMPMIASPVFAAEVTWTGASDADFWNPTNWDNNQSPDLINDLIVNRSDAKLLIDSNNYGITDSSYLSENALIIGKALNNQGMLTIDIADTANSFTIYGDLKIGIDGGIGRLDATKNEDNLYFSGINLETLSLGQGSNSLGTVNLLGQGKLISDQYMWRSLMTAKETVLGVDGGKGVINIQGGSLDIAPSYDATNYYLALGSGTDSVGEINILGGGKLTTSLQSSGANLGHDQTAVIGVDGGSGHLTISGSVSGSDGYLAPSRATLGQGLAVGTGTNSVGQVSVLEGGVLRTFSDNNTNDPMVPNTYQIEVGVNNGTGSVLVSGAGSRWEVSGNTYIMSSNNYGSVGKLELGNSGDGTLTISHGATVALGKTQTVYGNYEDPNTGINKSYVDYEFISGGGILTIAESSQGKGVLNIGASLQDTAVAAGTLEADNIIFGAGDGRIVFNHTESNYQFDPILSGTGVLSQKAGTTWLNGNNTSLSGSIELIGGTLGVANSNSLGSAHVNVTGDSILAYANAIELNNSITINAGITLAAGIDVGNIAIQHGVIAGAGGLKTINEGTLTLTGANTLTGQVHVDKGVLALTGAGSLAEAQRILVDGVFDVAAITDNTSIKSLAGSGGVTLGNKDLIVTAANDTFSGDISGGGTLSLTGGTLTLTGVNTYTGNTTIENGTLIIQDIRGGHASLDSQFIDIKASGTLGGYGTVAGDVVNKGTLKVGSAIGNFNDFGAFTIKGNYIGENGTVIIGTVLAGDGAPSDRLVIEGDASGQSNLMVNNIRGVGAQTTQGIEVIEVQGNSNAQFDLVGRAVAGAYEYNLNKDADGNWYLRSDLDDEGNGNGNGNGNGGNTGGGNGHTIYRPEVGSYLANIAAVNTLFLHQLNDRMPQSVSSDGRSAWVRAIGDHGKFRDSSNQLRTSTNSQVLQVGGDILAKQLGQNGLIKFGAMFGYGHTKSTTRGQKANVRARSSGDGYALGIYGTWFQNNMGLTGAYVDSWLQYVHFDNNVKGNFLQNEGYKAKGLVASIEAGYTFKITPNFFIQPQAQVTWMNVKADNHREYNGTRIRSGGQGNVQTRVGARAFGEFGLSNGAKLRPYAELNWLHNTKSYYVDMDGTRINQQGAKNIGQIKAGINAQFNDQLSVWGDLSHDIGKNSYRNTKVSLGLKYTF